jgi:hypothetical protein
VRPNHVLRKPSLILILIVESYTHSLLNMDIEPSNSVQQYLCKHVKRCDPKKMGEMCAICLEPCSWRSRCFITHCGHHYHDKCILRHFKNHSFCPLDRRHLFDRPTHGAWDIYLDDELTVFFSYLPDVVAALQPHQYFIDHLKRKGEIFDDVKSTNHLRKTIIPRIIKSYRRLLDDIFGRSDKGPDAAEKRAYSFSGEAITYYVTAMFIDKIKSRLSLRLWLQLEKMNHQHGQWLYDHRPARGEEESQEQWFLEATLPDHSFAKHIAHILGRGDTAEVTCIEVAIEYASGDRGETLIVVSNPGDMVDLQFGNGVHGLTIQLLHGQILKITDWRATGMLSLVDLEVRPENAELLLQDPEGNKYTYIFRFD